MSSGVAEHTAGEPVTVLVARRVRSGMEAEFEVWARRLTVAARTFDGFLGWGLMKPADPSEPWHIVYRFRTAEDLSRWEESEVRASLLAEGDAIMATIDVTKVTGLETWFGQPGQVTVVPPRWKMFVVSAAVIYVLQLVLNMAVHVGYPAMPIFWRVLMISASVTALMTWVLQPVIARLLAGWLYGSSTRSD